MFGWDEAWQQGRFPGVKLSVKGGSKAHNAAPFLTVPFGPAMQAFWFLQLLLCYFSFLVKLLNDFQERLPDPYNR